MDTSNGTPPPTAGERWEDMGLILPGGTAVAFILNTVLYFVSLLVGLFQR